MLLPYRPSIIAASLRIKPTSNEACPPWILYPTSGSGTYAALPVRAKRIHRSQSARLTSLGSNVPADRSASPFATTPEQPPGTRFQLGSGVVNEGDPLSARIVDPAVACGAHALRSLVPQGSDPSIADGFHSIDRAVLRAVVDDDHLKLDVLLPQHGPQREHQEIAPIVRRDHHGDLRCAHRSMRT